jgi:Mg/Co/Ni transporter MgtE
VPHQVTGSAPTEHTSPFITYSDAIAKSGEREAAELLTRESDPLIASVLAEQNPGTADAILWAMSDARRLSVLDAAPPEYRAQWQRNHAYPEGSIGRLMTRRWR